MNTHTARPVRPATPAVASATAGAAATSPTAPGGDDPRCAEDLVAAFGARCEATPDQVAVIGPPDRIDLAEQLRYPELSYRQLSEAVETAAAVLGNALTRPAGPLDGRARPRGAGEAATALDLGGDTVPVRLVAVILPRSIEFVTAVLATLDAGAAYLPLDPDAGDGYLHEVLAEAEPDLVVTSPQLADRYRAQNRTVLTTADLSTAVVSTSHTDGQPPARAPRARPAPDAAYVIYTSGSTGRPKGVLVGHTALLNSTLGRVDAYGPAGRVPLLHSPGFDVATGVLFWTLLTGGTLVINPAPLSDVAATVQLIREHEITDLVYAAGLYAPFLDYAAAAAEAGAPLSSLRQVMIGSERWSPVLIDRHAETLPGASLDNEYGPTEACVWTSGTRVYDPATGNRRPLTLGQPIRHTSYHLLTDTDDPAETGHPAEIGQVGHLHISGPNLAIGYLHRPDLTAAAFITLPDGQRGYRTGDLAELTPNGEATFIGRADRQLKVAGNRIEPGHIETVLMSHPGIQQAHVITSTSPTGDAILIGYLVTSRVTRLVTSPTNTSFDQPNPTTTHTAGTLDDVAGAALTGDSSAACGADRNADDADGPRGVRAFLATRLPPYMIPNLLLEVPDLPRTASGKIDETLLPTPQPARDPAAASATGPRPDPKGPDRSGDEHAADGVEASVLDLARELLGAPGLDARTSLIRAGATSLTLIRLAAGIYRRHGVHVQISALFTAATPSAIADRIRRSGPGTAAPGLGALRAGTRIAAVALPTHDPAVGSHRQQVAGRWAPLSGQQRQIWLLHQLAPQSLAYNAQFSLQISGPLDPAVLSDALSVIVDRHEVLRTTVHERSSLPGGTLAGTGSDAHSPGAGGRPGGGAGGSSVQALRAADIEGCPDQPALPEVVQVVRDPWPVDVPLEDLTDVPAAQREPRLRAAVRNAIQVPFDPAALPLVRWRLFKLGDGSWNLLMSEHHFIHDGWSARVFVRDLRDAYTALRDGREPKLPDLPVQYGDYARWSAAWSGSPEHAAQLAYWTQKLAGAPAQGVTFEPDAPPPPQQSFTGACLRADVPADTLARIEGLCARHGVTRFAVFVTAFAILAWRHTGQRDLVIGSALSNRRLPETGDLIGMFVNALPLRLQLPPGSTLGEAVTATMTTLLEAQDHQELPLLDLLPALHLPRDAAHNPLFRLMFAFHDSPEHPFHIPARQPAATANGNIPDTADDQASGELLGAVRIEHNGSAKNDLNVICVPTSRPAATSPTDPGSDVPLQRGVQVVWEFDTALFSRATASGLLQGFLHILDLLQQRWEAPLTQTDWMPDRERDAILTAGRGPALRSAVVPGAGRTTLHSGVNAAVAAVPGATAVVHRGRALTYRELDHWAHQVQQDLQRCGVQPGSVIALTTTPGPGLVAAMLAVLRSSCAYLCLDSAQPRTRLAQMLQDSHATALLHDPGAPPPFVGPHTLIPVSPVAPIAPAFAAAAGHQPYGCKDATAAEPDWAASGTFPEQAAAYLVYTSGSTGPPKAVTASHTNAVAALHARTAYLDACASPVSSRFSRDRQHGDQSDVELGNVETISAVLPPRTLITLPATFDVAPSMIFWTLWQHGTIVFPDDAQTGADPAAVVDLIDRFEVTHVNFTASFYAHLLRAISPGRVPALQVVAIGGEPCPPQVVKTHAAVLPQTWLHNEYGPTESTVWASAEPFHTPHEHLHRPAAHPEEMVRGEGPTPADDAPPGRRISVGRPLSGVHLYVLDDQQRLCPPGARGELYIGGAGVTGGYLDRPDLTAARFITPTTGPLAGQRLYRTGDAGRLNPLGRFEVLGRLDDQVKIRGYRIEPDEITHCLLQHPDVIEAHVTTTAHLNARGLPRRADASEDGTRNAGQDDSPGDSGHGEARLIAYVVPRRPAPNGSDPSTSRLEELRRPAPASVPPDLVRRARRWAADRLPGYMVPAQIVVVDNLPRTSNGKIDVPRLPVPQRPAPTSPDPSALAEGSSDGAAEALLLAAVRTVLGPGLGLDDDFFAAGGDSLLAIRFAAAAARSGIPVSAADVLRRRTVRALAETLTPVADRAPRPDTAEPDQHRTAAPAPGRALTADRSIATRDTRSGGDPRPEGTALALSGIQGWFFAQHFDDQDHFNQARTWQIGPHVPTAVIRTALAWVTRRHPALRTRFTRTDGHWAATLGPLPPRDGPALRVQSLTPDDRSMPHGLADWLREELTHLHRSLSIEDGRLFAVALFTSQDTGAQHGDTDPAGTDPAGTDPAGTGSTAAERRIGDRSGVGPRWLCWVMHHLIVDAVSWDILTGDLQFACDHLLAGRPLPDREAAGMPDGGQGPDPSEAELRFWQTVASAPKPALPRTADAHPRPVGEQARQRVLLSVDATAWLLRRPPQIAAQRTAASGNPPAARSVLLAALAAGAEALTGSPDLYLMTEGHGRTDLDSAHEIVGWLTSLHPVLLRPDSHEQDDQDADDTAEGPPGRDCTRRLLDRAARIEAQLRAVPADGVNYTRARYLQPATGDADRRTAADPLPALNALLRQLDTPDVTFNYLGGTTPPSGLTPSAVGAGSALTPTSPGDVAGIGPSNVLPTALDITVQEPADAPGQLAVRADFAPRVFDPAVVDHLLQSVVDTVESAAQVVPLTDSHIGTGRRCFAMAPVDGEVSWYEPLAAAVADSWQLYGVRQPDPADAGQLTVTELAARAATGIQHVQPTGPYTLIGWSFGAAVAFATAQHLHDLGHSVDQVILLDPPSPGVSAARDEERLLQRQLAALAPHVAETELQQALRATTGLPPLLRAQRLEPLLRGQIHPSAAEPKGPRGATGDDSAVADAWQAGSHGHGGPGRETVSREVRCLLSNHAALDGWQPSGTVERLHLLLSTQTHARQPDLATEWPGRGRQPTQTVILTASHADLITDASLSALVRLLQSEPDHTRPAP